MTQGAAAPSPAAAGPAPTLVDRLEHLGFRLALRLCRGVPQRWISPLSRAIGWLVYHFDRRDRRIAERNLTIAFPERSVTERRAILRAMCRHLARMAFEIARLPALTPAQLSRWVTVDDPARFDAVVAQARERGSIILTAHFGNWELLAYACGLLGHPVTLIHRRMRNDLVDRAILALRAGAGTHSIPKRAAAKEALRRLRARHMVAIPIDQNQMHRTGVFVDFFGTPACTTDGPARLAAHTGAPIIPVFIVREGDGDRHRIVLLPEIEPQSSGDREVDVVATTQRCTAVFEEMVRRHPEQWIWFHKRWKTRPVGKPPIY
jgi:KDO2-lipid IV(A) lauroyltransferase